MRRYLLRLLLLVALGLLLTRGLPSTAEARLGGGQSYRGSSSSSSSGSSGYSSGSSTINANDRIIGTIIVSLLFGGSLAWVLLSLVHRKLGPRVNERVSFVRYDYLGGKLAELAAIPVLTSLVAVLGGPARIASLILTLTFFVPEVLRSYYLEFLRAFALFSLAVGSEAVRSTVGPWATRAFTKLERAWGLNRLRDLDPCFSRVVFLDFANALFHRFHEARGHGQWRPLRPFLSGRIWARVEREAVDGGELPPDDVQEVIVGGLRISDVEDSAEYQRLRVRFRANITEVREGHVRTWYHLEDWTFTRPPGSVSPPPQRAKVLGCPSCGSPVQLDEAGCCTFCDQPVATGDFGWRLLERVVGEQEPLPPLMATSSATSAGGVHVGLNHYAEVQAGKLREELLACPEDAEVPPAERVLRLLEVLAVKTSLDEDAYLEFFREVFPYMPEEVRELRPDFQEAAFLDFCGEAFRTLQDAWSQQDLAALRSLETDALYATHRFWVERYRDEGLVNLVMVEALFRPVLCRVEVDAFYESITVRVGGLLVDVTHPMDEPLDVAPWRHRGLVQEYWTFVRTKGAELEGRAGDLTSCPACGAPGSSAS